MFNKRIPQKRTAALLGVALIGACGFFSRPEQPALSRGVRGDEFIKASVAIPADSAGRTVYRAAKKYAGSKILVSTEDKWLWFVVGRDTLMSAPIAIGIGKNFEFNGKKYFFATPRGRRKVIKKELNPIWTVPEWHYYEKAAQRGIETVQVVAGKIYPLADGTWIQMRGNEVGRVNQFGNFWPFTPGIEIIFDNKLFIPPTTSPQRKVPDALGPAKLDMGEGYLIHGTHEYNEMTIGSAASHGCVRMRNNDVERLFAMVEPGTPVFIF
jgi:hypothetical protein